MYVWGTGSLFVYGFRGFRGKARPLRRKTVFAVASIGCRQVGCRPVGCRPIGSVDQLGVDQLGVDKLGVDQLKVRRNGVGRL